MGSCYVFVLNVVHLNVGLFLFVFGGSFIVGVDVFLGGGSGVFLLLE